METGPWLKDSSDRLVKLGMEPATPGLQGNRFIHYTTAAPVLCLLCFRACLLIDALWSPVGKGLTSWLSFGMFIASCCFPIGILGQVWYLIVSIPDLCSLSYLYKGAINLLDVDAIYFVIMCCILGNIVSYIVICRISKIKLTFFKIIFHEYHYSVELFGSRPGLTFCQA